MQRRAFLSSAALAWPVALDQWARSLPQDPWASVRAQFLIPEQRLYFNVGTLGPQPRPVVDAVIEHTRRVAESMPPGIDWDALRSAAAALLHCDAAGLVFPRNTTEGMNFVANGLELKPGDEVITTNHEHVGGLCCWQLVAARRGVKLRPVDINPALDPGAVFERVTEAITPATRVVSVSHVNFSNGLIMPVRELVQHCRPRGIITVIDGAHAPGLMRVDLQAIDADFYASSPHKWLFAAQGTGLLYMRDEWRTRLWPTLASGGWDDMKLGAHRFNHMGTADESRLAGLFAALRFHEAMGPERVYQRHRELRGYMVNALQRLPRITMKSPAQDSRAAGLVSFTVDGVPALQLQQTLGERNVRTRVIGEYDYQWMRLSASVYNTVEQIDRVVGMIRSV